MQERPAFGFARKAPRTPAFTAATPVARRLIGQVRIRVARGNRAPQIADLPASS